MSLESIWEVLQLPAVQRSAVVLAVAAIGLPIVGVFVVRLDIITVRFAVMHLALLGIAVGMLAGLDPYACALVICAAAGAALAPLAKRPGGLSGPMGFLMTIAIALALLVLSGVNATGTFELLWGSIFATRAEDIVVLVVLTAVVLALYFFRRAELRLLLFDREGALPRPEATAVAGRAC